MWRKIDKNQEQIFLKKAIDFIGNYELYGSWMLKVADSWEYSCEHNLTDSGINKQAWIGHAACCLAIGCPEYITRQAWWHLTKQQQDDANKKADEAIRYWEDKHQEVKWKNDSQGSLF